MWPLPRGMAVDEAASPQRAFYGDMAVSAKLLTMSSQSFGDVVFVYYERIPPQHGPHPHRQPRPRPLAHAKSNFLSVLIEEVFVHD